MEPRLCLGVGSGTAALHPKLASHCTFILSKLQMMFCPQQQPALALWQQVKMLSGSALCLSPTSALALAGAGVAAEANRASLHLTSQAFPFGRDAPQTCPSSTGCGVALHHSSPSPSFLPSSEEVRYGIAGSGERRRTAQESKFLQTKLGLWAS